MTGDEVSNYDNGAKPMTRLSPVSGVLMDVTRDLARGGIIPDGGENFSNPGTWRVTAVPEASTWAMLLLGLAGASRCFPLFTQQRTSLNWVGMSVRCQKGTHALHKFREECWYPPP